jgi:ribonuclease HI
VTVKAFTDGASRGNPGESGIGIVLKDEAGTTLHRLSGYIGTTTNNMAEYTALLKCLELASTVGCSKLIVHSDSELMVRQLNGTYKVKDPALKQQVQKVRSILSTAPFQFSIVHIAREENREADELANVGIESKMSVAAPTLRV